MNVSWGAAVIILGWGWALLPFLCLADGPLSSSTLPSLCLVEPPLFFPLRARCNAVFPLGKYLLQSSVWMLQADLRL